MLKTEEKLLFEEYLKMQSKKFKDNISGYEKFKEPCHDVCIKVNFKNSDWLRVYRNKNNGIEWY